MTYTFWRRVNKDKYFACLFKVCRPLSCIASIPVLTYKYFAIKLTNVWTNLIIAASFLICLPACHIFLRMCRNMVISMMHVLFRLVMCLLNTHHLNSCTFLMTTGLSLKPWAMESLAGSHYKLLQWQTGKYSCPYLYFHPLVSSSRLWILLCPLLWD